jgi:organic hydroperoxide reductase OsmC/OhrA
LLYDDVPRNRGLLEIRIHRPGSGSGGNRQQSGHRLCFSEIVIRPCLTIPNEEQRERAISLLHKAKALCLVSRARSTAQKFEARVEISKDSLV